ncbi:MAG: hypothetical protein ABIT38_21530 [Gemmatimonadaceae bacterium]
MLVISDARGNRGSAPLNGVGIAVACEMKVVPCNYGHLYTGTFSWTSTLTSATSNYSEEVHVAIANGKATCVGTVHETQKNTNPLSGSLSGPGLFAVEFENDSAGKPIYRITAACPTFAYPQTADAAATPSRPAELGHNDRTTYEQPATGVALASLQGSSTYPSPDEDSVNGVTGTVTVKWTLRKN